MTYTLGKSIIFGERFVFETETEANIITGNSLPIEKDELIIDQLYIYVSDVKDYLTTTNIFTDYFNLNENISNLTIQSASQPNQSACEANVKDYLTVNVTATNDGTLP